MAERKILTRKVLMDYGADEGASFKVYRSSLSKTWHWQLNAPALPPLRRGRRVLAGESGFKSYEAALQDLQTFRSLVYYAQIEAKPGRERKMLK
jgi:hypothetical protein